MNELKSYNIDALMGDQKTDREYANDLAQYADIIVPDHLLYTPEFNHYILNEARKINLREAARTKNPATNAFYTEEEARKLADEYYSAARKNIDELVAQRK